MTNHLSFSIFNVHICPDKRISDGKVLFTKTWKVKNRVAIVLRRIDRRGSWMTPECRCVLRANRPVDKI
jgi:hypothetical protein